MSLGVLMSTFTGSLEGQFMETQKHSQKGKVVDNSESGHGYMVTS